MALFVFQAGHVGEQDQFFCPQHFGHLAGHQVGIDVVAGAAVVHADGGDNGDEVAAGEQVDNAGVDALHFAHVADVDDFRGLQFRAVRVAGLEHHLAGLDQAPVLAGEADGLAAVVLDQVDDVFIDQAAEHHLHHVHGFPVGDTHALNKFRFLAQTLQQVADLWATAVHDHRVDADLLHHHHVTGEAVFQLLVFHGVTAVFDHHGGAGKTLNVGQRLNQNPGGVVGTVGVHGVSLNRGLHAVRCTQARQIVAVRYCIGALCCGPSCAAEMALWPFPPCECWRLYALACRLLRFACG